MFSKGIWDERVRTFRYFLGIEVARSTKGIVLTQQKYIIYLLEETGMLGCKPVSDPIEMNYKLKNEDRKLIDKEKY